MVRIVFTYIIPFLLPSAVYLAWGWYRTRYVAAHHGVAPTLERGPWALLMFLGAVLTLASLAITGLRNGGDPNATYIPPHLENGKVVPGRMEERAP